MELSLYDILHGNWSINRVIDDHRAEQRGIFTGTAQFSDHSAILLYAETGELRFAGTQMRAERRYRWHCVGNQADVFLRGRVILSSTYRDGQGRKRRTPVRRWPLSRWIYFSLRRYMGCGVARQRPAQGIYVGHDLPASWSAHNCRPVQTRL